MKTTIPPAECQQVADRFRAAVATLPRRRDTDLRRLWLAAAEAAENFAFVAADARTTDAGFSRAEDAALDTERALRDHLLIEHGLTMADLRRSVL